jgi:hypothetical protein
MSQATWTPVKLLARIQDMQMDGSKIRIRLAGGDEHDALSDAWRPVLNFRRGERKASKRSYNKRLRKSEKQTCKPEHNPD